MDDAKPLVDGEAVLRDQRRLGYATWSRDMGLILARWADIGAELAA